MGDRLVPRSKSELQLEKIFFASFDDFFVIWAFSRNFILTDPLGNNILRLWVNITAIFSFKKHKNWIFSKRASWKFFFLVFSRRPNRVLSWSSSHSSCSSQVQPNAVQAHCVILHQSIYHEGKSFCISFVKDNWSISKSNVNIVYLYLLKRLESWVKNLTWLLN